VCLGSSTQVVSDGSEEVGMSENLSYCKVAISLEFENIRKGLPLVNTEKMELAIKIFSFHKKLELLSFILENHSH
jgi:hypothetical protein